MNKWFQIVSVFLLCILSLTACLRPKNNLDKSVEQIEVKLQRFDLDLILADTAQFELTIKSIYQTHPAFLSLFSAQLEGIAIADTTALTNALHQFVSHPDLQVLLEKNRTVFSDISIMEVEISTAFSYLKHYFPAVQLPELYLFVSGLHTQFLADPALNFMGIGSDFYLGSDFELYQSLFYDYMLPNMRPEQLPVDLLSNVLFSTFRFDSNENRLLDSMLYRGKVLYLLSVFLPERSENEIIGFTAEQQKWAEKYEKDIWKSIVGNKALFSTDQLLIRKYMEDAPFTAPVSPDSPGRLGEWIGLQVVKSYMKNNKKIGLPELMKMNDYQKMLRESGY